MISWVTVRNIFCMTAEMIAMAKSTCCSSRNGGQVLPLMWQPATISISSPSRADVSFYPHKIK